VTTAVLDHVAIGTRALADGWELFGGLLGGRWAYGADSPGYWWGQLQFRAGPKIELLTPTGGADSAFLERFLVSHGPGPHHLNFLVPDIEATLGRVGALGVEPVGIDLSNPQWKEAFLHPRDAYGIVIQVAQQSGPPPPQAPPPGLPEPGPDADLAVVEHHVDDLEGAVGLFSATLDGQVISRDASAADLTWPGGARLRLVQTAPASSSPGKRTAGGLARLHFAAERVVRQPDLRRRAEVLSERLGVSLYFC
jgi:catechol 2,3-dioxygenase-like lactoylglutathione lyase family enzyme